MTTVPEFERAVREVMEREGISDADARAALLRLADAVREPAPTYQPGDVAIATVRGVEGVQVVRTERRTWFSARSVRGYHEHLDAADGGEVTVTSRAVVVTEADRGELISLLNAHRRAGSMTASIVDGLVNRWFAARLGDDR